MTGYGPVPVGAYTFRKRQSSDIDPVPKGLASWTQPLPNFVASSIPVSGAAFCGGIQRSGPTGGAAYGMPLKLRIVAVLLPAIVPTFGRVTTSGVAGPPSVVAGPASTLEAMDPYGVPDVLLQAAPARAIQAAAAVKPRPWAR